MTRKRKRRDDGGSRWLVPLSHDPSKYTQRKRTRQAEEAGYSVREIDFIAPAPYKFNRKRWIAVRAMREEAVEWYCRKFGLSRPRGHEDWVAYRRGNRTPELVKRIRDWGKGAERMDAVRQHQTIFDIFYEGTEGDDE